MWGNCREIESRRFRIFSIYKKVKHKNDVNVIVDKGLKDNAIEVKRFWEKYNFENCVRRTDMDFKCLCSSNYKEILEKFRYDNSKDTSTWKT